MQGASTWRACNIRSCRHEVRGRAYDDQWNWELFGKSELVNRDDGVTGHWAGECREQSGVLAEGYVEYLAWDMWAFVSSTALNMSPALID